METRSPRSRILTFCSTLFIAAACALLIPGVALAASVKAESTTIEEVDEQWTLKLVIDLGAVPDINYVPMSFVFQPTVLYDRICSDESQGKPVLTKKQLHDQPTITVPDEVSFSGGMGKTYASTKYNLKLKHDNERFYAGEYKLDVQRDGKSIGKMTIVLNGKNRVQDHRSMTFAGENKPKNDPCFEGEPPREGHGGDTTKTNTTDTPSEGTAGGTTNPPGGETTASGEPGTSGEAPPAVQPKQGGCGCKVIATEPGDPLAWLAGAALVGAVVGRRLRRR